MSLYRIPVTIYGTAYIRAAGPNAARQKAAMLHHPLLEVRDAGSEIPICGVRFSHPDLPDVSLSPAMTLAGPEQDDEPEPVEDGYAAQ